MTTNPAAEALSDEQIETISRAHGTGGWQTLGDMNKFARAVIAADRAARKPLTEEIESKCKTCGGTRVVHDGWMESQGGVDFDEPIQCVKDCPDCTYAALADRALWLADKIPAYGDYAKEAAYVLRTFAAMAHNIPATQPGAKQ